MLTDVRTPFLGTPLVPLRILDYRTSPPQAGRRPAEDTAGRRPPSARLARRRDEGDAEAR